MFSQAPRILLPRMPQMSREPQITRAASSFGVSVDTPGEPRGSVLYRLIIKCVRNGMKEISDVRQIADDALKSIAGYKKDAAICRFVETLEMCRDIKNKMDVILRDFEMYKQMVLGGIKDMIKEEIVDLLGYIEAVMCTARGVVEEMEYIKKLVSQQQ